MSDYEGKVVVVTLSRTPTSPILTNLLHILSHEPTLSVTVLTRDDFSTSELDAHIANTQTVICALTGSDIHLTPSIIEAASKAGVKLFIPSEYSLDTSNAKMREILPPYQTRFEIQERLRKSGMDWKAIYSGIVLEDGLKTDGVLGIDALWASVVVFPHKKEMGVAVSTCRDIAKTIVDVIIKKEKKKGSQIYVCSFRATLDECVEVVEKEIDKSFDRYEGEEGGGGANEEGIF